MIATLEMSPGIGTRPVFTATIRKGPRLLWSKVFRSEIVARAEIAAKLKGTGSLIMDDMTRSLAAAVEKDLADIPAVGRASDRTPGGVARPAGAAGGLAAETPREADNVVPLRPPPKPLADAILDRAKLADLHRRYAAQREQRIAERHRAAKAEAAEIARRRDEELARHEAAMGRLERAEAELCAATAAANKADRNVVAACRALLATLDEEA